MVKIYRYELNNEGPYACYKTFVEDKDFFNEFKQRLFKAHSGSDMHPCVRKDLDEYIQTNQFCACESRELLAQWFDGFVDDMLLLGFSLVEIEVKDILKTKSGLQCVF